MHSKGQQALESVKRQQRRLEINSVKNYKMNIQELEERRQKVSDAAQSKAKQGQREFLERERAQKVRLDEERLTTDQSIVQQLYSLEVKLKVGQERAKNWKNENLIAKAQEFNKRVDNA